MLGEWIFEFHKDKPVMFNYPLGSYAIDDGYRIYMSQAPRCDALLIEKDKITVVEAKVVDEHKGIGELLNYKRLVPKTMSLKQYWGLPIELILLRAREREDVTEAAINNDITPIVFCPKWCREYLDELIKKRRQR
jgi:hypothetical protein